MKPSNPKAPGVADTITTICGQAYGKYLCSFTPDHKGNHSFEMQEKLDNITNRGYFPLGVGEWIKPTDALQWHNAQTLQLLEKLQGKLPKKQHKYKLPNKQEAGYNQAIGNVENVIDTLIREYSEGVRGE